VGWKVPDKPNVILDIVVCTFKQDHPLKCLVESFLCQTNPSWRMLIIHDGPDMPDFLKKKPKDKRITVFNTPTRYNDYGHTLRDVGLRRIQDDSYYTLITNGDNYYAPVFVDEMCMNKEDLVYCNIVHNHWKYEARESAMHRRGIDIGAAVVRTDIAKKVGFPRRDFAADWFYFEEILKLNPTIRKVNKVLFCHN
jgi:hypothetical protein